MTRNRIALWAVGGVVALALFALIATIQGSPGGVEREVGQTEMSAPPRGDSVANALSAPRGTGHASARDDSVQSNAPVPETVDQPRIPRPWDDAEWQKIPLDKAYAESLGELSTRRAFSQSMRDPPALASCVAGWNAPPGVAQIDMKLELRVRSADESLVVEDAVVREASVSDADLERCVVNSLRGRKVATPGLAPGQAFRLEWGARTAF